MEYEFPIWLKEGAIMPTRAANAVGLDLYAKENFTLYHNNARLVKFGVIVKPPVGHHFELVLRSGIANKVMLANGIGIIDPNYCGPDDEIGAWLVSYHGHDYCVTRGDRLCQLILRENKTPKPILQEGLPLARSRGGFGSTGR